MILHQPCIFSFLHQMKLIKPPQFLGEIQHQTLHCFLLPDGRESGDSLPAEGYIFVTSYRVMFIGTPCDPSVRNSVVIRTMPLASLYQIKELTAGPFSYPAQGLTVAGGIQMRALSGQASAAAWCTVRHTSLFNRKLLPLTFDCECCISMFHLYISSPRKISHKLLYFKSAYSIPYMWEGAVPHRFQFKFTINTTSSLSF